MIVSLVAIPRDYWGDFGSPPARDAPLPESVGRFGMLMFLLSLTALFAPLVVAFAYFRFMLAGPWPPEGLPPFPRGLYLSTLLLIATTATLHAALRSIRRGRTGPLRRRIVAAVVLGVAFLATQGGLWVHYLSQHVSAEAWRFAGLFYFFAILHALHVTGGLIPLVVVAGNTLRGRYDARRHGPLLYCTWYWHFLDAIWLVMFVTVFWPA